MKKGQKISLWCLLCAGAASAAIGIVYHSTRWVETSGLLFGIAGVVQLEISGIFTYFAEKYGNPEKSHGPPSRITREIISIGGSETPIRTWLKNTFYVEHRTGFCLVILAFIIEIAANWLDKLLG